MKGVNCEKYNHSINNQNLVDSNEKNECILKLS